MRRDRIRQRRRQAIIGFEPQFPQPRPHRAHLGRVGAAAEGLELVGDLIAPLAGDGVLVVDRVPGRGVRAAMISCSPAGLAGSIRYQAATAGSFTMGSWLNGAIVSSIIELDPEFGTGGLIGAAAAPSC